MEKLHDLDTFAEILTSKGYTGYFHTEGAFPGKIKESLNEYVEACRIGIEYSPKAELTLTSYLKWDGDELPHIQCNMLVKYEHGKFDLQKMEVSHKDCYGQLLKKSELANITTLDLPKIQEAIATVRDIPEQKNAANNRRFKL